MGLVAALRVASFLRPLEWQQRRGASKVLLGFRHECYSVLEVRKQAIDGWEWIVDGYFLSVFANP